MCHESAVNTVKCSFLGPPVNPKNKNKHIKIQGTRVGMGYILIDDIS
jgi:hypothetical protein